MHSVCSFPDYPRPSITLRYQIVAWNTIHSFIHCLSAFPDCPRPRITLRYRIVAWNTHSFIYLFSVPNCDLKHHSFIHSFIFYAAWFTLDRQNVCNIWMERDVQIVWAQGNIWPRWVTPASRGALVNRIMLCRKTLQNCTRVVISRV